MSAASLHHAFFTNAPGRGGDGYRVLCEPPDWARVAERLARWLEALVVEPQGGRGLAVNVFRLADIMYSCIAAVDGAFGPDSHGRGRGHLAHLMAVPLSEGVELPSLPALLELVRSLARPEGTPGNLESLVDRARAAAPPASEDGRERLADLACLDRGVLARFLDASSSARSGEVVTFPVPDDRDLAAILCRSAGALPPRIRLATRWAVGLAATSPIGFLAVPGPTGAPSHTTSSPAARYLEWLCDRLDAADAASIRRLTGDWEIRSWEQLMESTC